ncbi:MAG: winged helix-turn-helix domain-containing protein [Bacillota bacterium]
MYQVKYKVWLDRNGKVFGDGPYHLLKGIEDTGSLNTSARAMKMSYSQAYKLIKNIEKRLGFFLIKSQAGGQGGGGSQLTDEAKELMNKYLAFQEECRESIFSAYEKHFGASEPK